MNRLNSLKTLLLVTAAFLVILTGIVVSQIVIRHYSATLVDQAIARAESIARKLALDVADLILINDLVSVQKILDDQMQSETSVSYLFVVNNQTVLVHTFRDGIPVDLIHVNSQGELSQKRIVKLVSENNERFVDIRWPVFNAKAGVLRLGISEAPIREKVRQLSYRMSLITMAVMAIALLLSYILVSRLLRPMIQLTEAVRVIDENRLDERLDIRGPAEINRLVTAYNGMLKRIDVHTQKLRETNQALEQKNIDLDRAHSQFMTACSVSRVAAALPDLERISTYLVKTLQKIVKCGHLSMVVIDDEKKDSSLAVGNNFIPLKKADHDLFYRYAVRSESPCFMEGDEISALTLPQKFPVSGRVAVFPFHHHRQILGAVLVSCRNDCVCAKTETGVIQLILEQTSGAVFRASEYEKQIRGLKKRVDQVSHFQGMVGKDPKIQVVYKLIEDVAPTDATILIQGESGTGKEMVAKAVHELSHRSDKPFIVINCSAYPATLLESELFGHEEGAFTGALRRKTGRFEQASGGTVFLDEIGEISPSAQTMLLRVLQSQKIERIGGEASIRVDVRILAATNRNLMDEVKKGSFREDLFYRLNVIPINLPSLWVRKNDIVLLARFFLEKFSEEQDKTIEGIDSETLRVLMDYHWPGNIRELENCIEYAVTLSKFNRIFVADLPGYLSDDLKNQAAPGSKILLANEESIIRKVCGECGWNKTAAALNLGISRSTLYEKLRKYGIISPGRRKSI